MSYERLVREHDAIDTLAARLQRLANGGGCDAEGAERLLHTLSSLVSEHLSHEDRTVYRPLIERRAAPGGETAIDFEAEFQALRTDWENYLAEWNVEMLAADWETFASETDTMMARLRERVRAESDLIYPMALRAGAIRLRDDR